MSYGSATTAICTVSGNSVSLLSSGTCTVTANRAGNTHYSAAPQVTLDIPVNLPSTSPPSPTGRWAPRPSA